MTPTTGWLLSTVLNKDMINPAYSVNVIVVAAIPLNFIFSF